MRDLIVLAILLGSAPICFFRPYFGVLLWSWIAFLSPHRYTWGAAYHFPVAEVIAVPTLMGLLFTRKINRQIFTRETTIVILLWAWFGITMLYAANQPLFTAHLAEGVMQLKRVSKILLMTMVTILLVTSRKRLKYLSLVTAMSFGLLAIKGAFFGMRTGGKSRVWGPPDSFMSDNNDFALAVNMALPFLFFLAWDEENAKLRLFLRILFFCGVVSVILTYSRGGLLGLAVVLSAIAIKSHRKLIGVSLLVISAMLVLSFAPHQWMTRMHTLVGGSLDDTAKERVIVWRYALNLVHDYPVTGGGFSTFPDVDLFQRYSPEPLPGGYASAGPHSIYFQVLGEQGFVGLALFASLLGFSLLTLRRIRRRAQSMPAIRWTIAYTHMLEASLLAYMVSGAFLGRAYFDLFYQIIACTIILKILYRQEVALAAVEPAPALGVAEETELVTS